MAVTTLYFIFASQSGPIPAVLHGLSLCQLTSFSGFEPGSKRPRSWTKYDFSFNKLSMLSRSFLLET